MPPSRALPALVVALAFGACRAPGAPDAVAPDATPYVLVLGTAQDGGLPQVGCHAPCCVTARADPARRRLVSSLALVDPRHGRRYLFDATPDLREQIELLRGHPRGRDEPPAAVPGPRPALVDGIFLTHAHMGHYTGLVHLGPEAYGARGVPVYASERMAAFLRANGPWSLLVESGVLVPVALRPGEPIALADDLTVTALPVPHRDELSDTLAFRIEGPHATLLFLPDIDAWHRWDTPLADALATVDHALVDGTFYDGSELPDRDLSEIPHPFITDTLRRVAHLPASERGKLLFTHLNHSNPAADPTGPAAAAIAAAGAGVAPERHRIPL